MCERQSPTYVHRSSFVLSKKSALTARKLIDLDMTYTISQLLKMSSSKLNEIYKAAKPGPIPDGDAKGTPIIAPDTPFNADIAEFINLFLWQGKVFDAKDKILVNKKTTFGICAMIAEIRVEPS